MDKAAQSQKCADVQGRSPEGGMSLDSPTRERPSRHGALLGQVLSALEQAGRRERPDLPEMCATCAFRDGCMTNQMAATGLTALNCVLGIDPDRFACHHGMKDGEPTKLCAGYIAAILAPFDVTKTAVEWLRAQLADMSGPDAVRAEFDAWAASVDPNHVMDDYQRGRAFLRHKSEAAPLSVAAQVPQPIREPESLLSNEVGK